MVKSNNLVKKTAAVAVSAGVAVGLTLASAPGATAAGEKIVFIQGVKGDGFYITMECGVKAAAKKLGVTTTTQGPAKFDATLQRPILASVVASKPSAILIAPNDVNAMQKPLEQAAKAGIKIVLVDTTVKSPGFAVSQISSNNLAGGAAAFAAVKKLVPEGGKVMGIGVKPGISTTDARDKGFKDAVNASGGKYTFLSQEYSNNEPSQAAQITTAALAANPDLKAIFASNLFSAEGAATGIKQAGKEGQVKIIGFDAGPVQVKALIAQQPYDIGLQGVTQAVNALRGKATKKKITTGFRILTPQNIDTAYGKGGQYLAKCA
jgi:ribose transport system substrate-binding protein